MTAVSDAGASPVHVASPIGEGSLRWRDKAKFLQSWRTQLLFRGTHLLFRGMHLLFRGMHLLFRGTHLLFRHVHNAPYETTRIETYANTLGLSKAQPNKAPEMLGYPAGILLRSSTQPTQFKVFGAN